MKRYAAICILSVLAISGPPQLASAQTQALGELFNSVTPAPARQPGVDIASWIERLDGKSLVRLSLNARNGARLVADPGIVVRPLDERLGTWIDPVEVSVFESGSNYFSAPPIVDVGFINEDGKPVRVDVDYAYCLADEICLFGNETIAIETQSPD